MQQVLIYGDSLSWGIIPDTRQRFAFEQRWPGVMENDLNQAGLSVRVIIRLSLSVLFHFDQNVSRYWIADPVQQG